MENILWLQSSEELRKICVSKAVYKPLSKSSGDVVRAMTAKSPGPVLGPRGKSEAKEELSYGQTRNYPSKRFFLKKP